MRYLLLLLLSSTISNARIGETIEECRKRYGKETSAAEGDLGTKTADFEKSGVSIQAKFKDRICVDIAYFFPAEALKFKDGSKPHRLSPTTVRHLLDANGEEWIRIDWESNHDSLKYISKNGTYATFTGQLVSFSNSWYASKFVKIDFGKEYIEGL